MRYGFSYHSSLITHHYCDRLRLAAAEREVVVADADFEGVAEGRGLDDADGRAGDDAHLHQAARHRALAAHREHARGRARPQAVERDGRRGEPFGAPLEFVHLFECGVGETHKSFTIDDGSKIKAASGTFRPTPRQLYPS